MKRKGEAYEEIGEKLRKWNPPRSFTQREFCEATDTPINTTTFRMLHLLCDVVKDNSPMSMPTKYRWPKRPDTQHSRRAEDAVSRKA